MNIKTPKTALVVTLLASAALLSACDRAGDDTTTTTTGNMPSETTSAPTTTTGQAPDAVVTRTDRDAAEVARDGTTGASQAGSEMATDAREAGREAGQAIGNATDAAVDKTKDIAITTAINAKLAADDRLSALKIDVDTDNGRVVLRGTAPDTASRNRATDLARTVDGVSDVNNELSVQPDK